MGYAYTVHRDLNLALIQLEGELNYLQEVEAVSAVFMDDRIKKDVRILIDRTRAPIQSNPEKVNQFIEVAANSFPEIGRPKVALVVADEVDYGMTRMLELQNDSLDSHDIRVFFELDHALNWLGVELNNIS